MSRLVEPLPRLSLREPKIGPTIDHQGIGMQLRSHLTRSPMRQSEEDHIVISEYLRRGLYHQPMSQWSQLWMVLAKLCSRISGRRHSPDLHLRMGQQQPEQLSARITCCASYGDPYSHSHDYAIDDKVMHVHVSRRDAVASRSIDPQAEAHTRTAHGLVNITVPDELLGRARRADLNVSRIASAALAEELDRLTKIAELDEYLAGLNEELGPPSEEEVAAARVWVDELLQTKPTRRRSRRGAA
jgi:post-segregation antitoxin (ccd killing protein)